jgi:hypothetical protein
LANPFISTWQPSAFWQQKKERAASLSRSKAFLVNPDYIEFVRRHQTIYPVP